MKARSTWQAVGWSLILALLVLALRWPSLTLPLDRDEGAYATMAWAWQQHGLWPYVDLFDHKPPLLYGLYAQAFAWGGPSVLSLRLFSLLWQAVSVVALQWLLLRWSGFKAAMAGTLAFALLCCGWRTQAIAANAETWVALPLIAGLALLRPWDASRNAWRWVAWGVAAGVAASIKQPCLIFALGLPLFWAQGPERWRACAWTALGLVLLHAGLGCAFGRHGGLQAWWQAVYAFNVGYSQPLSSSSWEGLRFLARYLAPEQGGFWLLALVALATALPLRGLARAAAVLMVLGFGAAALSGRWYPHYAQHWSLGLALAVAAAFDGGSRVPKALAGAAALLALGLFFRAERPYASLPDGGQRSLALMGTASFVQAPAIASWVAHNSSPQDRLLIWGAEPELYFLSQRLPATHQLNDYALTGMTPRWPNAEEDFLAAAKDPRSRVLVMMEPLDRADPFQAAFGQSLEKNFQLRQDLFPPYWVGVRRR